MAELFIIIHSVITLTLFILLIFKQRKINHYEKTYEMEWGQPTSIDGLVKYKENLKTLEDEDEDLEDLIMLDSIQEEIYEDEYKAACLQAEIEYEIERREIEQLKDWTPPSYEDVVDPEFDRGFNMAYDKAIGDVMNYLQGLRDSDDKWSI